MKVRSSGWGRCAAQAGVVAVSAWLGFRGPVWAAEPAKPPDAGLPLASAGLSEEEIRTISRLHGANLAAIDIATHAKDWAGQASVKTLAEDVRRTRVTWDQRLINFAADQNVPLSALLPGAEEHEAALVVAPVDDMVGPGRRPPREKDLVRVIEARCTADAEAARRAREGMQNQPLSHLLQEITDQLEANRRAAADLLVKLEPSSP